ncbi:MAG: AsnC family transcriptional regulator [Candidatus Hodarchaeota archaeon]
MDPQDWALIRELEYDPRLSYQTLAKKFNVSPNTIKNRIKRMREQRMLGGGYAILSREMVGVEDIITVITTDGSEKGVELMQEIATQPSGCEIYRTGDRRYELWAMVAGTSEALGLKKNLENLASVIHVEMRPIYFVFPNMPPDYFMNTRGKKVNFSQKQLLVLRQLVESMRMPVTRIAQRTGITPRRVRKIISDLQWGGGVHLCNGYNIFALGDIEYRLKIWWDPNQTTGPELATVIAENYSDEFWWSSVTTNEPILDVGLIISDANQVVPIIREIKANPHITAFEDFVTYPRTAWPRNPLGRGLRKLLGLPELKPRSK